MEEEEEGKKMGQRGEGGKEREKQTSVLKDHATQRQLFLQKVFMATLVKNRQKTALLRNS